MLNFGPTKITQRRIKENQGNPELVLENTISVISKLRNIETFGIARKDRVENPEDPYDKFLRILRDQYCRVREIGGQRARPREELRYCSCGMVAEQKNIRFFVAGKNQKCKNKKTRQQFLSWSKRML